jgi:hypothetical protein
MGWLSLLIMGQKNLRDSQSAGIVEKNQVHSFK